jgi:hypothetical protein
MVILRRLIVILEGLDEWTRAFDPALTPGLPFVGRYVIQTRASVSGETVV